MYQQVTIDEPLETKSRAHALCRFDDRFFPSGIPDAKHSLRFPAIIKESIFAKLIVASRLTDWHVL